MKSKFLFLSLSIAAGVTLLSGCGSQAAPAASAANTSTSTNSTSSSKSSTAKINPETDAVTGASQVNDETAFENAISANNKVYMIIVNKDLTFTKDLTVVSGMQPGEKGAAATPNRSIAPAVETSDHKISKRYTITVPNLVFSGENEKVEYGIIKGNVYVQAKGFTLKDATIDGNLYFANNDLKNAFKKDATTKITGQIAVKAYSAK